MVSGTDDHDGVKGTVKNFTSKPIRVADTLRGAYVDLAPGQQVTYYGSSGTSLGAGGEGKQLSIKSLDPVHRFGANEHRFELADPDIGRPDTRYWFKCNWSSPHTVTDNIRRAWDEGESHNEIARDRSTKTDTKFWVKREDDGWDGGYETEDTEDWQVFTIHVDSI